MKKINIKTKLGFLQDMINYYSVDPINRRNSDGLTCKYYPQTQTSEGCAIGRHISEKLQLELDNSFQTGVTHNRVFNQLPVWMKKLGQPFLTRIQMLHDDNINWEMNGLSEEGINTVKCICTTFNIDFNKLVIHTK